MLLEKRLCVVVDRLDPPIPAAARADAVRQVIGLGIASQLSANRRVHRLPVSCNSAGETCGDFFRLIDRSAPAANEWPAVNQFPVRGPHHTRRPDIILFVNGLLLVLPELKQPADDDADVWSPTTRSRPARNRFPTSSTTTS